MLTRDTGILDWCLTNHPKLLSEPKQLPKLGSSNHYCVLVQQGPHTKVSKRTISRWDMRESAINSFGRWLTSFSWDPFYRLTIAKRKLQFFITTLTDALDRFMPLKVSLSHSSDKPWLTHRMESHIVKRQEALASWGKDSPTFHMWRNKVQRELHTCKQKFYQRKVRNIKDSNISQWWSEIKALLGSSTNDGQWFNLDSSSPDPILSLCEKVNNYLADLTLPMTPLSAEDVTGITVDEVLAELLTTTYEIQHALTLLKAKKASRPNGIPNLLLKTFAFKLVPVVCELYNASLLGGCMPSILKTASVRPLPKQKPAKSVSNNIRPISLTSQVSKVLEGLSLTRLQPSALEKMDCRQFAVAGRSTEQAIVYFIRLALEALDCGRCAIRFFFTDFWKALDLIDHHILLQKLSKFNIHAALLRWVAAFLQGRTQITHIGDCTSSLRSLDGGIPQGTKLGPILFSVMVNDLVSTWAPRAKFVDDLSILEIIPRNSPSLLGHVIKDIQSYAHDCNMCLNPAKCKEMSNLSALAV